MAESVRSAYERDGDTDGVALRNVLDHVARRLSEKLDAVY
jgi:hypothetical protein